MIDYYLKKQMEQALLDGRKQDALMLSQKLDVQKKKPRLCGEC